MQNGLLGKSLKDEAYEIIGGGISGLSFAFFMKEKGMSFRLTESAASPGGLLKTVEMKYGIAEPAANAFVANTAMDEMIETLGLTSVASGKLAKKRFLVKQGKLNSVPLDLGEIFKIPFIFFSAKKWEGGSVEDLGRMYLGENLTRQLLEPALAGIYGAPLHQLDVETMFPGFDKELKKSGRFLPAILKMRKQATLQNGKSIRKGSHSFEKGMIEITNALSDYVKDETISAHTLKKLEEDKNYILTLPAYKTAELFENHKLKELFLKVRYTPLVTTTLIFKKKDLPGFKPGFGCLIPRREGFFSLGVLFNNYIFPGRVVDEEYLSLTMIFRDEPTDKGSNFLEKPEDEIIELLYDDLKRLFGLEGKALEYKMWKYEKGIPIYSAELRQLWKEINELLIKDFPNVRVFGNYTGNISIRAINLAARKIIEEV
ncbi:MAG: hypothetical protein EA412_02345 [Chitinophagaceae bacterium]|nr:MAG: hypothetical protein EA412_02345 [Chitinophagaceae bacterium]